MITTHEQQTTAGFSIGWINLDLPRTLNALSLELASAVRTQLSLWAERPDIACVVLQGEGRAFCAGGDVRRMREGILAGNDYCERFFEEEYRLDFAIHRYPKPLLVWGHGIVMGGGLGLLVGASHRIVTPSTRMAMPEASIGLYPDVGASYFLNQLPPGLGLFLGITGCEWNGADALALGFADYLLDDDIRDNLPRLLDTVAWTDIADENRSSLDRALGWLTPAAITPQIMPRAELLGTACNQPLNSACTALQALDLEEPWFKRALDNLAHGCPVTACLVAEQLQRGQGITLADAFRMEWIMSVQCCRHQDFPEGVRAQLVDKDKQPRWQFRSIAAVPHNYVTEHFHLPVAQHPLADLD
jgi:enoyl-CoA hydratase/carnithine racemase